MTTHYADFDAGKAGLTLTVELFALGSDAVSYTAGATSGQTNRLGVYRSSFTGVAAGFYEIRARVGTSPKAAYLVKFAGTDAEVVSPADRSYDASGNALFPASSYSAPPSAATIAAAVRDVSNASPAAGSLGEAVNNGIGGGSAGSGARTVTFTVDDGSDPLENAIVRVIQGTENYSNTTDVDGEAVFALDDATWSYAVTKPGYLGATGSVVVNGTEAVSVSLTALNITPSPVGRTTGYLVVTDEVGDAAPNIAVDVLLNAFAVNEAGIGVSQPYSSKTTDTDGYVEFVGLPQRATYFVRVNGGEWTKGTTSAADTTPLVAAMGPNDDQ